jgi:hypothetical protein
LWSNKKELFFFFDLKAVEWMHRWQAWVCFDSASLLFFWSWLFFIIFFGNILFLIIFEISNEIILIFSFETLSREREQDERGEN